MPRRPYTLPLTFLIAGLAAVPEGGGASPLPSPAAIPAAVASDYVLFAHLDAKAARDGALLGDVKRAFARAGGAAEWDGLHKLLDKNLRLGIGVADIDALTLVIAEVSRRGEPKAVLILTSAKPIDRVGAFGVKPGAKPDDRGFYPGGSGVLVHFPNEKTVAALHPDLAQKYLGGYAKDRGGWPLTPALSKAAAGHTLFAALRPDKLPAEVRKEGAPREFGPLLAARGATLTADLKDKELRVAARATFADATVAGKARHKLHALVGLAGDAVDELLAGAAGDLGAMRPAVKEAEGALAAARVELDGADLVASATYKADFEIEKVAAGGVKYLRDTLPRVAAAGNLREIAVALHNYAGQYGDLLPVHGVGAGGAPLKKPGDKPLLSWRVAILAYVGQDDLHNLYKQFKLDEPWDSENNKKLIEKMPKVFAPTGKPGKPGRTHMQMVVGPAAMRPGAYTLNNIPDGTSSTIAVVEAAEPVIWTKPDDIMLPGKEFPKDFRKKFGGVFPGGFHAMMWDGSVRFVADSVSDKTLGFALCPDDGNVLGADW